MKQFNQTYSIDTETIITQQIKVTNQERRSIRNLAIGVSAISKDVVVVLRMGLDYADPTAYAVYTLTNPTVTSGETNIYQVNGYTVSWVQLTLTSSGLTDADVVINPDFGGVL